MHTFLVILTIKRGKRMFKKQIKVFAKSVGEAAQVTVNFYLEKGDKYKVEATPTI